MKMSSRIMIAVFAVMVPLVGIADVRPAALFADSIVMQRETKAPVWGWADPGEKVTVTGTRENPTPSTTPRSINTTSRR